MSPEERSLLERTYKMVEENNTILKSIRRTAMIGNIMKVLYWVVVIGLSFGAFYFIQPYLNAVSGGLTGAQTSLTGLQDLLK